MSTSVVTTKLFYFLSSLGAGSLLHFAGTHTANHKIRHHHNQVKSAFAQESEAPLSYSNPDPSPDPDPDQSPYTCAAKKDQITNLPGLDFEPEFNQFSGYINVSETRSIHYWYIESSGDPSTDPVVFWTNGGPGCSGLLGLGTEFGPFLFGAGGILSPNPNTWNQAANILYVEQPAGVGFSYFTDESDKEVGDDRAAVDNHKLIVDFFNRFPERQSNEFYIASESYGGHYIPHLAKEILSHEDNENHNFNFRGLLVGNPYVDPISNDVTMIQTYYMHGLIALPLFNEWSTHCTDPENYPQQKCNDLFDAMFDEAGDGINPYAVDYPVCTEPDSNDYPPRSSDGDSDITNNTLGSEKVSLTSKRNLMSGIVSTQSTTLMKSRSILRPPFLSTEDVYHPCAENHLFNYLNRDDVKAALHVKGDIDWSMCTDDINYSDEDHFTPQMDLYEDLINELKVNGSNLKMMIFSGDDDSVCSTASTQYWIYDVGVKPKDGKLWNAWKYENQTAGYITEFDLGETDSSFVFVTVHGAGHEVPAYRPAEALAMFQSYFSGEWEM